MMVYDEEQVNKMLNDERDKSKVALDKEQKQHDAEITRIGAALGLALPTTVESIVSAIKAKA